MALTEAQRNIMDSLFQNGPQSVRELASSTGYSLSLIRIQVQAMGRNLKVDNKRQPFIYEINPDSNEIAMRMSIDKAKRVILKQEETDNAFLKLVLAYRKEVLRDVAPVLESIAIAIHELERDGLLVDTLEVAHQPN
jgi:CO dehydrogenase/acetyl-CoA synthase gamma subunit (corrinoid Fe-S protein)